MTKAPDPVKCSIYMNTLPKYNIDQSRLILNMSGFSVILQNRNSRLPILLIYPVMSKGNNY